MPGPGQPTGQNTPLARILRKISAKQPLTAQETSLYTRMRTLQRGLPDIPDIQANNVIAGQSDRGADPAFKSSHADPSALMSQWARQRTSGIAPSLNQEQSWYQHNANSQGGNTYKPDPPSIAPTLDQEQSWYQHNANSQGGNTYIPNASIPGSPGKPDFFPGTDSGGGAGASGDINFVTHLPDEAMPNIPNVSLSWHDFTPQAQQKVAGAYAPLYQAINQGRTNATAQEKNSAAVVGGLYDDLAKQRKSQDATTTAQYNTAAATSKASDDQMVNAVKGAGDSATAQLAQVMAQAGLGNGRQGTAAADELSQQIGTGSQAVQQAQLQAGSDASNVAAQKQNQLDYSANTGAAEQRQGEATQEGLQNQLTTTLGNYDQQRLTTKADEAQQGLTMAQQMSQNDWTAQTGAADQTWNAYNAAMGQTNARIGMDQANAGLQNQAANAEMTGRAAAASLAEQQAEFNSKQSLELAQIQMEDKQKQAVADAKAAQDAAMNPIEKQRADAQYISAVAALNNSQNSANKQQGTDPTQPNYNPLMDPTSAQYLAAHNGNTMYNNTVLGIVSGGRTDKASTDLAQSYMSLADSTYAQVADRANSDGNPGMASQQFTQEFVKAAQAKGLQPGAAAAVASAWLKAHPEVIKPQF
jgi:hypothetical protein